jgi:hypothetical protein
MASTSLPRTIPERFHLNNPHISYFHDTTTSAIMYALITWFEYNGMLWIREWILLSSGMWCHVVWQVSTDIPLKPQTFFQNVHIWLPNQTESPLRKQ